MKEAGQSTIENHPLWPEYRDIQEAMIKAHQEGLDNLLDIFEDKLTKLAYKIAGDLEIEDAQKQKPLYQKWEHKWSELRDARRDRKSVEEENLWQELKELAYKLEIQNLVSKN